MGVWFPNFVPDVLELAGTILVQFKMGFGIVLALAVAGGLLFVIRRPI